MRHRFEDSCNMNILNWKLYRKINSIRTWSSQKGEFLSKITLFLTLKFEIIYFQFKEFYDPAKYWSALQIRTGQLSITANPQPLTAHIYHLMIMVTGGFSKKSFFINIISIS